MCRGARISFEEYSARTVAGEHKRNHEWRRPDVAGSGASRRRSLSADSTIRARSRPYSTRIAPLEAPGRRPQLSDRRGGAEGQRKHHSIPYAQRLQQAPGSLQGRSRFEGAARPDYPVARKLPHTWAVTKLTGPSIFQTVWLTAGDGKRLS